MSTKFQTFLAFAHLRTLDQWQSFNRLDVHLPGTWRWNIDGAAIPTHKEVEGLELIKQEVTQILLQVGGQHTAVVTIRDTATCKCPAKGGVCRPSSSGRGLRTPGMHDQDAVFSCLAQQ
eukprot:GHUV01054351.1.p1 GENE.GHUV01054351.1~~GHUV01054351.1.p1  ORF type:complete len:119 (-),score=11.61 GHUV01054351.1:589-945(-)